MKETEQKDVWEGHVSEAVGLYIIVVRRIPSHNKNGEERVIFEAAKAKVIFVDVKKLRMTYKLLSGKERGKVFNSRYDGLGITPIARKASLLKSRKMV